MKCVTNNSYSTEQETLQSKHLIATNSFVHFTFVRLYDAFLNAPEKTNNYKQMRKNHVHL